MTVLLSCNDDDEFCFGVHVTLITATNRSHALLQPQKTLKSQLILPPVIFNFATHPLTGHVVHWILNNLVYERVRTQMRILRSRKEIMVPHLGHAILGRRAPKARKGVIPGLDVLASFDLNSQQ